MFRAFLSRMATSLLFLAVVLAFLTVPQLLEQLL